MADDEEEAVVDKRNYDCGVHTAAARNGSAARIEADEIKDQQHILFSSKTVGDLLIEKTKSKPNLSEKRNEMKKENSNYLATLRQDLNQKKEENKDLKKHRDTLMEQLVKSQELASKASHLERETLRREHGQQLEQLATKMKSLQQTFDELYKEKETLVRDKVHLQEQLQAKALEKEDDATEQTDANDQLNEWHAQKKSLSIEDEWSLEQLLVQSKELQFQVTSLQSEKNQLLSERDELQSVVDDIRLQYAVATEELSQSNKAARVAIDGFSRIKTRLHQANKTVEIQSAENQDLTREVELSGAVVQRLEAANVNSERKRETVKQAKDRGIEQNGGINGGYGNALDKYSNDSVNRLRQNASLIDRLQIELESAQNTINALTNQNTELKNQLKSRVNQSSNGVSVSESDGEKDTLEAKLDELLGENQLFLKKLESVEEDLTHQVPATVNGDVVTKTHFEALQSVMKRLETKYTRVMADKTVLMDTAERLEHVIMQLRDESDTIGEYVSLYHHQWFNLRRKTEEKDDYICQLANERTALQNQLAQLQLLIIKLLNEHGQTDLLDSNGYITAADSPVIQLDCDVDKKKENGQILSDVKISKSDCIPDCGNIHESGIKGSDLSICPPEGDTAQKIFHLLNEIGMSKIIDGRSFDERNYIHCCHCSGEMLLA